jgi:hypothetical protein
LYDLGFYMLRTCCHFDNLRLLFIADVGNLGKFWLSKIRASITSLVYSLFSTHKNSRRR